MAADIVRARYYPTMPPALPGETDDAYTDRLTGADKTDRIPYDHRRYRQCSIGWHAECTDPEGVTCRCPCHSFKWIRFEEMPPAKDRKMPRWLVHAKQNDALLGEIKWHGAWRQYAFFPETETIFAGSCFTDLERFIRMVVEDRKARRGD